jgi:hypothetical protein
MMSCKFFDCFVLFTSSHRYNNTFSIVSSDTMDHSFLLFVPTKDVMQFWLSRWSAARLMANNLRYQTQSRYLPNRFWAAFWVSHIVNSLVQPLALARYPAVVVKAIQFFGSRSSHVNLFPGLFGSRSGQFYSTVNFDEATLAMVYGGADALAALQCSAPISSLPERWVQRALPDDFEQENILVENTYDVPIVMVTPRLSAPVYDAADFPDLGDGLVMSDEVKTILSVVIPAGLGASAAALFVSSWANEVWGMMTSSHREKYLQDPLVWNLGVEALSDPDVLSSALKVSHSYLL